MDAPCKNCTKRTAPKTCETNCELWQKYQLDKRQVRETIKENKRLDKRINDNIWRNKR